MGIETMPCPFSGPSLPQVQISFSPQRSRYTCCALAETIVPPGPRQMSTSTKKASASAGFWQLREISWLAKTKFALKLHVRSAGLNTCLGFGRQPPERLAVACWAFVNSARGGSRGVYHVFSLSIAGARWGLGQSLQACLMNSGKTRQRTGNPGNPFQDPSEPALLAVPTDCEALAALACLILDVSLRPWTEHLDEARQQN